MKRGYEPRQARDRFDALNCQVPGCRASIRAMTGFQEIEKLMAHMRRVHLSSLTMNEALELRAAWESRHTAPAPADPGRGGTP